MAYISPQEAFTQLFERENDALFRFCYWRVSDRERALELTQEAFARLWEKMALGDPMESPRAFLYTVTRNMIIDWYRKHKSLSLDKAMEEEDGSAFEPGDSGHAADEMETLSDAKRALYYLDQIDEDYRESLYLRFVEDLPPREIAEVLGLNANIVSIRITRGLEELRKLMNIKI